MRNVINLVTTLICLVFAHSSIAGEDGQAVGADLYQKQSLPIKDIPKSVIKKLEQHSPGFIAQEADVESKKGERYMDIEGKLPDGTEIEFDLILEGDKWTIVEIQRDIEANTTPKNVLAELNKGAPGFKIDRIIESDQGNGVIIYEFYSAQKNQKTLKKEVKLEGGKAELLKKEWKH